MSELNLLTAEVGNSPESIVTLETIDMLVGMGNHEAKLLALLYFGSHGISEGRAAMHEGFLKFIGKDAKWKPAESIPFAYCEKSLAPYGHVVEEAVPYQSGFARGYKITDKGLGVGTAIAGQLLAWSLSYPELSLQTIFGPTRSSGQTRAPQHRVRVLMDLITTNKEHLSVNDMIDEKEEGSRSEAYRKNLINIDSACGALEQAGLVEVDRVVVANNTRYTIRSYDKPELSRSELSDVVNGVYEFLATCKQQGLDGFTYADCLAFVTERLRHKLGNIDEAQIRDRLTRAFTGATVLPGLERQDASRTGNTEVRLVSEYRAALQALFDTVLKIDGHDPMALATGHAFSRKVQSSEAMRTALLDKAYAFSKQAKGQPREATKQQLMQILNNVDGPINLSDLHARYENAFERKVTPHLVRTYLGELAADRVIRVIKIRGDATRTQLHNFYEIGHNF